MAGTKCCTLLIFADPIEGCCIILNPRLNEKAKGCASLLHTHGMWRGKSYTHTVLKNYPLYCPKCKQETLIEAGELKITVIKEAGTLISMYAAVYG